MQINIEKDDNVMKKKILCLIITFILIISATTLVFAATSSRTTTYDMVAGVYSKSMDIAKDGTLKVAITPNLADSYDTSITLYVDKKQWYGWGGSGISSKEVNSWKSSTTTFSIKKKGTYRVYMSNPYRLRVKGSVKFTWTKQ